MNQKELVTLPCEYYQAALETPFFGHQMQQMNATEEAIEKMVHQNGKKQIVYLVTCVFLQLPANQ